MQSSKLSFAAVLRKRNILLKRNKRQLLAEIANLFITLVVLGCLAYYDDVRTASEIVDPNYNYIPNLRSASYGDAILFAPCTTDEDAPPHAVQSIMNLLKTQQNIVNVKCFPTESELLHYYNQNSDDVFGGVIFDNQSLDDCDILQQPIRIRYRFDQSSYLYSISDKYVVPYMDRNGRFRNFDYRPDYKSALVPLQNAVQNAIQSFVVPESSVLENFRVYPFPEMSYDYTIMGPMIGILVPVLIAIYFTMFVRIVLTDILTEKESKRKIMMNIMGLPETVYWASWTTYHFIRIAIVVVIVTAVGAFTRMFLESNSVIVLLVLSINAVAHISLAYSLSAFFSKARTGGIVGFTIASGMLSIAFVAKYLNVSTFVKYLISLMPPAGLVIGLSVLSDSEEGRSRGIHWSDLADRDVHSIHLSGLDILVVNFLSLLIFTSLAVYLNQVIPSEFGTTKHPLFCLGFRKKNLEAMSFHQHKEYLKLDESPSKAAISTAPGAPPSGVSSTLHSLMGSKEAAVEPPHPQLQKVGKVEIRAVSKLFGASDASENRLAVDNLNLDLYEGQVTCLLGHNGAGKTTTISILTGLIGQTAGEVYYFGKSMATHRDEIRKDIGVCPQFDVIWDTLTVREHFEFFAQMKGATREQSVIAADRVIGELGLEEKADSLAKTLSGGQKRRLSLGCAIAGNPKVLFLDEPTSGLDPTSRRKIWSIVEKYKASGNVVVLTTHFMDEADILGDRIALMANGRLRCCGSSLYLKQRMGLGFTLNVSAMLNTLKYSDNAIVRRQNGSPQAGTSPTPENSFYSDSDFWTYNTAQESLVAAVTHAVPGSKLLNSKFSTITLSTPQANSSSELFPTKSDIIEATFFLDQQQTSQFPGLLRTIQYAKLGTQPQNIRYEPFASSNALPVSPSTIQATPPIFSFSVSMPTLEQVFLKLSEIVEAEEALEREIIQTSQFATSPTGASSLANTPFLASPTSPSNPAGLNQKSDEELAKQARKDFWWVDSRCRLYGHDKETVLSLPAPSPKFSDNTSTADLPPVSPLYNQYTYSSDKSLRKQTRDVTRQMRAVVIRKYQSIRRDRRLFLLQTVVPVLSLCIGLTFQALNTFTKLKTFSMDFSPVHFNAALQTDPNAPSVFSMPIYYADTSRREDMEYTVTKFQEIRDFWPVEDPGAFVLEDLNGTEFMSDNEVMMHVFKKVDYAAGAFAPIFHKEMETDAKYPHSFKLAYNYTLTTILPTTLSLWKSTLIAEGVNRVGTARLNPPEPEGRVLRESFEPFPEIGTWVSQNKKHILQIMSALMMSLYLGFGFLSVSTLYVATVVGEKEKKIKSMSALMGLSKKAYWLGTLIWDGVIMWIIPALVSYLLFIFAGPSWYRHGSNPLALAVILILSGISAPGFAYIVSFIFDKAHTAQLYARAGYTMTFILFFALNLLIVMEALPTSNTFYRFLRGFVLTVGPAFPPFAIANAVANIGIFTNCDLVKEFMELDCDTPSAFDWHIAGKYIVYMILSIPVAFLVLIFLERYTEPGAIKFSNAESNLVNRLSSRPSPVQADEDVEAEKVLIQDALASKPFTSTNGSRGTVHPLLSTGNRLAEDDSEERPLVYSRTHSRPLLSSERTPTAATAGAFNGNGLNSTAQSRLMTGIISQGLKKAFFGLKQKKKRPDVLAVRDLWLGVGTGEIMGLLGPNGAGKSTTLEMLMGELAPSEGNAILHGYSMQTQRQQALGALGYCPQFDALIPHLTPTELLEYYARLAGVPERQVNRLARDALQSMGLGKYADKQIQTLSGGNKRKLSALAVYFVGPPVAFLDEPSTGVDPFSRSRIWAVMKAGKATRATVLTTHVMEEAEAVCDRIGILVAGSLACLAGPERLKSKYGSGYIAEVIFDYTKAAPMIPGQEMSLQAAPTNSEEGSTVAGNHLRQSNTYGSTAMQSDQIALNMGGEVRQAKELVDRLRALCNTLKYSVSTNGALRIEFPGEIDVANAFEILEYGKTKLDILTYSLSQSGLEQVFLQFCKVQDKIDEERGRY